MDQYRTDEFTKTRHTTSIGLTIEETEACKGKLTRSGHPLSQSLRVVCRPCNNEWMSPIQEATKPFLSEMIAGRWRVLTAQERTKLATWAALFTITWEFADLKTMAITQEEREAFRRNCTFPRNFILAASRYSGKEHGRTLHQSVTLSTSKVPLNLPSVTMAQTTTFCVGNVVLHTFSGPDGVVTNPTEYADQIGLKLVWPIVKDFELPLASFNDNGIFRSHQYIWRSLGIDVPVII
jgi:hypothetical protein